MKNFKKIKNQDFILKKLRDAIVKEKIFLIWDQGKGSEANFAEVKLRHHKASSKELVFYPLYDSLNLIKEFLLVNDSLNICLPEDALYFRVNLKKFEENQSIVTSECERCYIYDRRRAIRINPQDLPNVYVLLRLSSTPHLVQKQLGPLLKRSLYDLSEGGLSIIVNKQESKYLKKGQAIQNVEVYIQGKKLVLECLVLGLVEMRPDSINNLSYESYKVGFKITKISESDLNFLQNFILKNSSLDRLAI